MSSPRHNEDAMGSEIQVIWQTKSVFGACWTITIPASVQMSEPKHLLHRVVEEVCSSYGHRSQSVLHRKVEKGDGKNAFLQETFDDKTHGELAAEPVPELCEALNLREDEIVVLTESVLRLD